jgi:hypothetical protein
VDDANEKGRRVISSGARRKGCRRGAPTLLLALAQVVSVVSVLGALYAHALAFSFVCSQGGHS